MIFHFLHSYFTTLNRSVFWITTLITTVLVIANYTLGMEAAFRHMPVGPRLAGFFLLYAFTFTFAYFIAFLLQKKTTLANFFFYVLLTACPLLFAIKMCFDEPARWFSANFLPPWNHYAFLVFNWPFKGVIILLATMLLWLGGRYRWPAAGMGHSYFPLKPYFWLLLCMVPLLILAATMPDFLRVYPKLQTIGNIAPYTSHGTWWKLLFELSYGSDFLSIEVFFRGLLVLAFVRYAGHDAILPMAAFYCTIHFGKPLGECISSYFGGIILGVMVYNTGSIWGGLTVHLGIAWLMEVAGWLGHLRIG